MYFYLTIIISIIGLLIATYTDLKERIVSNKLNFSLAIIGLIIYLIQSYFEQTPLPIIFSLLGLIIGFTFGWILWKIGVFAGGDVKLFMALGALNPFTPAILKIGEFTNSNFQIFAITLFIYSLIGFLPYAMLVILLKLKNNKEARNNLIKDAKKRVIDGIILSILIGGLSTIFYFLQIPSLIILPTLILIGILKKGKIIITILISIIGLIILPLQTLQNTLTSFIFIIFIYGTIKLMLSLGPVLQTTVKISKLKEGMIPSKTLYFEKNQVKEQNFSIKQIIKLVKENKINEIFSKKNEIISATKARGLNEEEIKLLKKLYKNKKIGETIKIKESMPFVPTMLIGYLLCLIIGDAWILIW
ncbi:MAG TPA: A24 family peptidase C-terminal domain-containing protein [archaeon]|nr:A24 family peptidase C-terminal domain-containing protein [archaeon]